jgi:hypothetical protein
MRRLLPLMLLSGCRLYSTHEARDPGGANTLIGHSVVDVISCAGVPDARQQVTSDIGVPQWAFKSNDRAFKLMVPVLGSVQLRSAPQCKMTITFIRDGTVTDVAFPGCTSSLLGGTPCRCAATCGGVPCAPERCESAGWI